MADELGVLLARARDAVGRPTVVQVVAGALRPGSRPLAFDAVARAAGAPGLVVRLDVEGASALEQVEGAAVLHVGVPRTFRDLAAAADIDETSAAAWYDTLFPPTTAAAVRRRAGFARRRPGPVRGADTTWFAGSAGTDRPRFARSPRRADVALAAAAVLAELQPELVHTHDRLSLEVVAAWAATAAARPRLVHHAGLPEAAPAELARADAVTVGSALLAGPAGTGGPAPVVVPGLPRPLRTAPRFQAGPQDRTVATAWRPRDTRLSTELVEALAELPDVHLVLTGTRGGEALTGVLLTAQRLGVRARVHAEPGSGLDALAGVDLVVVDAEGDVLPVALAEALEAGCPVLVPAGTRAAQMTPAGSLAGTFPVEGGAERLVAALHDAAAATRSAPAPEPQRLVDVYAALLGRPLAEVGGAETAPVATPSVEPVGDGPRLGIGPANYAGQASAWASAARAHAGIAASSFGRPSKFDYPFDHVLPEARDLWGQASRLAWAVSSYDLLLLDGMLPLSEGFLPGGLREELTFLLGHGVGVGVVCHGSEIRDPDRHLARLPESYFRGAPQDWLDRVRSVVAANAAILADLADVPVLVSTPDLLLDVPRATWLPLTVDVAHWRTSGPVLGGARPRVLHAPSRSVPPVKGTHLIEPELQRLHDLGVIEYVAASGLVHAEMRALVHSVDVVVDQILTGSYGVAACEAMAAGRLVVGYVADDVAALMPERPPIVDVRGGDIRTTMERMLDDLDSARALAARGPGFTADWHDGRRAAEVVAGFVRSVGSDTEAVPT